MGTVRPGCSRPPSVLTRQHKRTAPARRLPHAACRPPSAGRRTPPAATRRLSHAACRTPPAARRLLPDHRPDGHVPQPPIATGAPTSRRPPEPSAWAAAGTGCRRARSAEPRARSQALRRAERSNHSSVFSQPGRAGSKSEVGDSEEPSSPSSQADDLVSCILCFVLLWRGIISDTSSPDGSSGCPALSLQLRIFPSHFMKEGAWPDDQSSEHHWTANHVLNDQDGEVKGVERSVADISILALH